MTRYSTLPAAHELPRQSLNMLRAKQGLPPLCFNRDKFDSFVEVQDGWTRDGRKKYVDVPFAMSNDCKAWDVRGGENPENPAVDSVPAVDGWRCFGCKWLPDDPRIMKKVRESAK